MLLIMDGVISLELAVHKMVQAVFWEREDIIATLVLCWFHSQGIMGLERLNVTLRNPAAWDVATSSSNAKWLYQRSWLFLKAREWCELI